MRIIGLTGGIASGKSTVAALFRQLGVPVVDADAVARELVVPGAPALVEIARRFGDVLSPDGALDREKLGTLIFAKEEERAALNAILHPRIQARVSSLMDEFRAKGAPLVLYDAALLIENSAHKALDGVIVVAAPEAVQIARLRERDGLDELQATRRIRAQLPLEEKLAQATWVIDNSGTLAATQAQVKALHKALTAAA